MIYDDQLVDKLVAAIGKHRTEATARGFSFDDRTIATVAADVSIAHFTERLALRLIGPPEP